MKKGAKVIHTVYDKESKVVEISKDNKNAKIEGFGGWVPVDVLQEIKDEQKDDNSQNTGQAGKK